MNQSNRRGLTAADSARATKTLDASLTIKRMFEEGGFEGYASVFEVEDAMGDVIARGAFRRSLSDYRRRGLMPAMLWQHDSREPIGAWQELDEDANGLKVRGRLFIDEIPRARQAHALLKGGGLSGLSIGFHSVAGEIDASSGLRHLYDIELLEISLVTFPAADLARVSAVKRKSPAHHRPAAVPGLVSPGDALVAALTQTTTIINRLLKGPLA
jgi:HK97 family phage prohead protease